LCTRPVELRVSSQAAVPWGTPTSSFAGGRVQVDRAAAELADADVAADVLDHRAAGDLADPDVPRSR
jgi:hypothetical protein